jgi:hypothetical protein
MKVGSIYIYKSEQKIPADRKKPRLLNLNVKISDISNLSQLSPITDTCYVSNILTVGSELVISFLNRANSFPRVCLFCIFVTNTIYVLGIEILGPLVLAR